MASTAQICLPYAGVEKERRCGVALFGLSLGATANAWTTRELYGAPSSNSAPTY
jgi:hypothetical protein